MIRMGSIMDATDLTNRQKLNLSGNVGGATITPQAGVGPQGIQGVTGNIAWQPGVEYATGQYATAPDGSMVISNDDHLSAATFAADESHWTPTIALPGTLEYAALDGGTF